MFCQSSTVVQTVAQLKRELNSVNNSKPTNCITRKQSSFKWDETKRDARTLPIWNQITWTISKIASAQLEYFKDWKRTGDYNDGDKHVLR